MKYISSIDYNKNAMNLNMIDQYLLLNNVGHRWALKQTKSGKILTKNSSTDRLVK
jgi:hypothetical protein